MSTEKASHNTDYANVEGEVVIINHESGHVTLRMDKSLIRKVRLYQKFVSVLGVQK